MYNRRLLCNSLYFYAICRSFSPPKLICGFFSQNLSLSVFYRDLWLFLTLSSWPNALPIQQLILSFIGWGRVPGLRNHVKSEKCQISLLRWRSKQQARPQLAESLHGKCVKSSAQIHKDFLDTHLKVLIVLFLFFNGEFWQTLFCCRHLLELNLRWSKFMQTGTLVIKLSPSSSSSLSWSSSSSPSLSSSPWKIAEFSRRPNDQITIDHTCRGLSEHCLSSKEKIAYRWERNYPKRNINLVWCLGGRGANIMAMTSVTLSSQLKSNFKDPLGRRPGLLTNVFLTHFIFFEDFIPSRVGNLFTLQEDLNSWKSCNLIAVDWKMSRLQQNILVI